MACISPSEILAPALYHGYYIRPRLNKQLERGTSEICLNQHKFQVFLDVCQFLPDELSVRTVDNLLEVAGQHPQKADRHGFVSREFTRTYILPLDVDPLLVRATLSHDGILSIVAPRTGKEVKARVNELERGTSEICLNQHKFQVFLDVCQFLPDELSVRTVDNLLEVAGQHPQKADRHGFVSREFTRTYILPLDVDPLLVRATLSHDGILSIVAPRTGKEVKARVNEVKIMQQEQPEGKEEQAEEGIEKEKS
ncbi:hypothetical protein HGM15179_014678 [Zosterops borbonicus]|uniref:SHSP domain-containing protein n=1 Tax=Zosterops borbonicus TaxID=364589 RepID=A0A8K1G668_9PASS|nr:hypothetical protein HGM15179_014678 [Zosterops borbonicus]